MKIRKAFKMKVYPEMTGEYIKRHNPIWKDLEKVLKDHGAHNYSIFLDEDTRMLFGYVEIESQKKWDAIAETEVCRKWWDHMSNLMETNDDNSPVSSDLQEVFHLE